MSTSPPRVFQTATSIVTAVSLKPTPGFVVEPEVHHRADIHDPVVIRSEFVEVVEMVKHDIILHPSVA